MIVNWTRGVKYATGLGVAIVWGISGGAFGGFAPQFAGLRVFCGGTVKQLCLVAKADAPAGMGGAVVINKNGVLYAVYLVETNDGNASTVRIQTTTGVKAIRLKT